MAPRHALHKGEVLLQQRRGTPSELTASMPDYITRDMPEQHADFFIGLPYLPLATLDSQGRPWASILVTTSNDDPSIGVKVSGHNRTDVIAVVNQYDPFMRALQAPSGDESQLFAGVGVDFTNRRRNKLAGSIKRVSIAPSGKVSLQLMSNQHLGNCPKYITVRSLEYEARKAKLALDSYDSLTKSLPDASKALIGRASTMFLATKHSADGDENSNDQRDMGLNHRGGAPGFVRVYEDIDGHVVTTYLVLPDHSGNRFYQSLGNIETDRQVGLVFPDFTAGDILFITGNAENLFDADAEALMPRVSLLTRIQVTGAVFVKDALSLRLVSQEEYSPYNPPVRHLRSELEEMGHAASVHEVSTLISATLVSTKRISETVSTFTFKLSEVIEAPLPGGFGIFDFSEMLGSEYRHMNEANPQLVNEDFVRTWTLSGAPKFDSENNLFHSTNQVSVTVKRKPGGLMSNFLHEYVTRKSAPPMHLSFKGSGVGFSCLTLNPAGGPPSIPAKMLWIAGGVGITPFMAMWEGITNIAQAHPENISTDIVFLFSGRSDDISLLKHILEHNVGLPGGVNIRVLAFQSVGDNLSKAQCALEALSKEFPDAAFSVEQRRLSRSDFEALEDLAGRDVFLCGPDALMSWSESTLNELGVNPTNVHREQFVF